MAATKRSASIRYLPPTAFPELPTPVEHELLTRKCLIPQYPRTWKATDRINVIRGEFAKTGQKDWAVLCFTPADISLLVFWNASDKGLAEVALDATDAYLIGGSVPKETLVEKYADHLQGIVPDHDAVGITSADNRTVVRYFHQGKWIQLGGGGPSR